MTDGSIICAVIAVAAVVVLYVALRTWQDHEQWKRQCERRDVVQEIQSELRAHRAVLLQRCSELDRKLSEQRRVLRYLARRLS